MKMKKSMIAVLGLLAASASAAVPIEIRVTGTATTSGFGYAQGSDYTFTFMLTDSYPGTGGDFFGGFFGGDRTLWSNDGYSGSLWMDVSGDGLVGAYTREGNYQAELFRADNDILYLLADNPFGTIGLQTSTGADVQYITGVGLNIGTINHLEAFENPATWLEPYAGTYDDQSAAEYIVGAEKACFCWRIDQAAWGKGPRRNRSASSNRRKRRARPFINFLKL